MTDLHGQPLSYNAVDHKADPGTGDRLSFESRCMNKQGGGHHERHGETSNTRQDT